MEKKRKRSGSIGKIIVFFLSFCFLYFASVVLLDENRFFQTQSSTPSLDVQKPAKWPFQKFKLPMVRKLIVSCAAVPALKTLPIDEKPFFQTQSSTLSLHVLKPAKWLFQKFKLPMVRKLIVSFAAVPTLKTLPRDEKRFFQTQSSTLSLHVLKPAKWLFQSFKLPMVRKLIVSFAAVPALKTLPMDEKRFFQTQYSTLSLHVLKPAKWLFENFKLLMVRKLIVSFAAVPVLKTLPMDEKRFFQTQPSTNSSTPSLDVQKPAKWPFQNFKLPMVRKLIVSCAAVPALKTLPMDEKRFFQTQSSTKPSTLSLDVQKPAKWPFQNFKLPMVRKLIVSFAAVPALKTLPMDEKRFFQTQFSTLSLDVLKPAKWVFQNFKFPMVRKLIVSFAAVPALKSAISAFPELLSALKSERMYNLAIFGPQAADLICTDMIAKVAMLSDISAPPRLLSPRQLFGKDNIAETFELIRSRVSGFKDHARYADWLVEVEGSVEGRDRSIGGLIWPSELTAPQTGRFDDPVEFGSSQVWDSVEHRVENSSGAGGSGAENAGEERNRSIGGGGNGNEGIGGARQGSGNEGRQGGLGAGGHGGDNGDDGGNNGGDRIIDIANGRIPPRNLRREELVEMYLPIIIQLIGIAFALDEANLSALGSVLRCFALVCCIWGIVFFTGSLFERGRNERAAGDWSRIGSTLAVLGLISIIALKLPLNLYFIIVLALLVLLAIVFRSFRT